MAPPLLDALFQFKGLPHRAEKIAEHRSVSYYDDSKGTNVGATVAALTGMPGKIVLIAGGDGKGQDFSPLNEAVARHARGVVLIGRDRERIAEAIGASKVVVARVDDMDEAVRRAAELGADVTLDLRHLDAVMVRLPRGCSLKISGSMFSRRIDLGVLNARGLRSMMEISAQYSSRMSPIDKTASGSCSSDAITKPGDSFHTMKSDTSCRRRCRSLGFSVSMIAIQ